MARWRWLLSGFLLTGAAFAQPIPSEVEIANLRQDIAGLNERVGELALRVDQLESQNAALKASARGANDLGVTLVQLNEAIAALNRKIESSVAAAKDDTLRQMSVELQKFARQTNAALAALDHGAERGGAGAAGRGEKSPAFSDNFPKEGENYVVQRGDTIAAIAKKTGAKVADIINANRLADPALIRAGQTLFIPGGK